MATAEAGAEPATARRDPRAGPRRVRADERFVLVTHENPDGDALGSLVAMHGMLRALGKDSVMFMAADDFPLPRRVPPLRPRRPGAVPPDDIDERTVVFLDCGNIDRNPVEAFSRATGHILNIDHHHDNTRFGTVNHVVPTPRARPRSSGT